MPTRLSSACISCVLLCSILPNTVLAADAEKPSPKRVSPQTAATVARLTGEVFKDCPTCPTLIVLPRQKHLSRIAIGQTEVTFSNWQSCVSEGVCTHQLPDDNGWGQDNRPVINVNWNDAKSYADWLCRKTGKLYRLPTIKEWLYAAQAGSQDPYWWGKTVGINFTNTADSGSHYSGKATALAGSFRSNPFGVFDLIGNVAEWTSDCSKPFGQDEGSCRRTIMGGAWSKTMTSLGVNKRTMAHPDLRTNFIGFRIVRELGEKE